MLDPHEDLTVPMTAKEVAIVVLLNAWSCEDDGSEPVHKALPVIAGKLFALDESDVEQLDSLVEQLEDANTQCIAELIVKYLEQIEFFDVEM